MSPKSKMMNGTKQQVTYTQLLASDDHALRAFIAKPEGRPRGAIVLLHQMDRRNPEGDPRRASVSITGVMPGVNAFARSMANRFADEGFLVVAPSTFGRGRHGYDRGYVFERDGWWMRLKLPLEPMDSDAQMLDLEAAILHARQLAPHARVGLVGYCWGGLLAWRAAEHFHSIQAAVCHYGGGMELGEERQRRPRVPVLAHWPDDPKWIRPEGIEGFEIESEMEEGSKVSHMRHAACYGFMNPLMREYDDAAANRAHRATLAFLAQHLAEVPELN